MQVDFSRIYSPTPRIVHKMGRFIEQIMKPHTPYYKALRDLFPGNMIHGMAHITGGGIKGNLCRIIPDGLSAKIDLSKIRILNLSSTSGTTEISQTTRCSAPSTAVLDSSL